jgi:hypothetical protein
MDPAVPRYRQVVACCLRADASQLLWELAVRRPLELFPLVGPVGFGVPETTLTAGRSTSAAAPIVPLSPEEHLHAWAAPPGVTCICWWTVRGSRFQATRMHCR